MNQPPAQPPMPYGTQQPQPQQPYVPATGKRPGSTSTKVWGIILLILGLLALLNLILSLGMLFGGVSGSTFAPQLDEAARQEMDAAMSGMIDDMLGRWTFWVNTIGELAVAAISVLAGWLLAIKPRPKGRTLAITRAVVVMLLLPVYGMETTQAVEGQFEMQESMIQKSIDREMERNSKGKSPEETERRKREVRQSMDSMQPIMRGAGYGMMVIIVVGVLVVNGLLLFFMTRPHVKTYLEEVANERGEVIPQYDPSMGIMTGPPPPQPGGPQSPQPPPANPDGGRGPHAL